MIYEGYMENLKEKERTIEELALFMRNKTDEKQSLYCMLLGQVHQNHLELEQVRI